MHALQLAGNPLRKMAKLTLPGRKNRLPSTG
jgi:hypothetical protein